MTTSQTDSHPDQPDDVKRSGGVDVNADDVNVTGDVVGRDKLVAGDDIIQTGQYVERQININLPRGAQIVIGVVATAIVAIVVVLLLPPQSAVANGDFESGSLDEWEVTGAVIVVESEESDAPQVGKFHAQLSTGSSIGQTVKVPDRNPVLSISYRTPLDRPSPGTLNVWIDDSVAFTIERLLLATEWRTAEFDMAAYAGQEVQLRIEYSRPTTRFGGVLAAPMTQEDDSVWIDRVILFERPEQALAQITIEPSITATLPASATSTATPTATATPRPTFTYTPEPTATSTATALRSSTTAPTKLSVFTGTLTFTWIQGAFREAGTNESGVGIWARQIIVEPSGGQPPYTIAFTAGNPAQGSLTFEVFGLYCEGQIGTLTVSSADGQSVSEQIRIEDPICPTPTPTRTNTSSFTPTRTPSPTLTSTPKPTDVPLPVLPVTSSDEVTIEGVFIQGQDRMATVSAGASVQVDVDYFIKDTNCPTCIVQIFIGIADDVTINEPKGCVYSGIAGSSGVSGSGSISFNVPATSGVYYIRFRRTADFSCPGPGWWYTDFTPGSDRNVGVIIVPQDDNQPSPCANTAASTFYILNSSFCITPQRLQLSRLSSAHAPMHIHPLTDRASPP